MAKKVLIFSLFVSCFFCFSQNEEPTIPWEDSQKLTWEDYEEQPDLNADAAAVTASGITFQYSIQKSDGQIIGFTTHVKTLFYPKKSWCNLKKANAHILSHEQLHFDITEWYARKFKQQIATLKISENLDKNLDSLYKSINNDLRKMQNLYDSETDFSRQIEAQANWQEQVHMELNKLSTFKSSN